MNYNTTVEGRITYNLDQALQYGDMPTSLVASRYEETDAGPTEGAYADYSRRVLTDWGPDTNYFAHEEPRGAVSRVSGRLQLQYEGHRGHEDTQYTPERFDGFQGPECVDPRGINTDPDFKELKKQHEARTRFVNFSTDASENITGGGISETKVIKDRQTAFKRTRSQLKIFDRQIDGRRTGLRREYSHKSNIPKQALIQSYGDYVKDWALTPQRRTIMMCKEVLKNTRGYLDETADSDFAFARYAQLCRRARTTEGQQKIEQAVDSELADADDALKYKAAAMLMSDIARLSIADSPDPKEHAETTSRKQNQLASDLRAILESTDNDADFGSSDQTIIGKQAAPRDRSTHADTLYTIPVNVLLDVVSLYKSVRPSDDKSGASRASIQDNKVERAHADGHTAKARALASVTGAKINIALQNEFGSQKNVASYKTRLGQAKRLPAQPGDTVSGQSATIRARAQPHAQYRVTTSRDVANDTTYSDNASKERRLARVGSKYTNRLVDRDTVVETFGQN